jgi:hypothetical protein
MALPEISFPAYTMTSSTDAGSAQVTLCVGRGAELIGEEGADELARQLIAALGALTSAPVYVTKAALGEAPFTA